MQAYQYQIIETDEAKPDPSNALNTLGKSGWHVVHAYYSPNGAWTILMQLEVRPS